MQICYMKCRCGFYFSEEIINIIGLLNSSFIVGKFSSISVLGSGSTQAFILNPLVLFGQCCKNWVTVPSISAAQIENSLVSEIC